MQIRLTTEEVAEAIADWAYAAHKLNVDPETVEVVNGCEISVELKKE